MSAINPRSARLFSWWKTTPEEHQRQERARLDALEQWMSIYRKYNARQFPELGKIVRIYLKPGFFGINWVGARKALTKLYYSKEHIRASTKTREIREKSFTRLLLSMVFGAKNEFAAEDTSRKEEFTRKFKNVKTNPNLIDLWGHVLVHHSSWHPYPTNVNKTHDSWIGSHTGRDMHIAYNNARARIDPSYRKMKQNNEAYRARRNQEKKNAPSQDLRRQRLAVQEMWRKVRWTKNNWSHVSSPVQKYPIIFSVYRNLLDHRSIGELTESDIIGLVGELLKVYDHATNRIEKVEAGKQLLEHFDILPSKGYASVQIKQIDEKWLKMSLDKIRNAASESTLLSAFWFADDHAGLNGMNQRVLNAHNTAKNRLAANEPRYAPPPVSRSPPSSGRRYFNNVTSVRNLNSTMRKLSLELHPNKGGSTNAFQAMRNQYERKKAQLSRT
jgi:hypothetical protein